MNQDNLHFTADELISATEGVWQGEERSVTGVFTDTRVSAPGALFAALSGEIFSGRVFLRRFLNAVRVLIFFVTIL
jgi:UDP-N-acetylmuramyl pentapeptide synthase